MANHLATFFLIAINRVAIKKFYEEFPDKPVKIYSLIGNDDSNIIIRGNDDNLNDLDMVKNLAKRFSSVHASYLSAFGVWFNAKKSFLSRYSLFYEEYSAPGFQGKESRYALIMANCISLGHIRMAKHMLKSFLSSVESLNVESLQPMINYATSFFGYEFYPEEAKYDYYLGGWIPTRTNFLSDVLYDVEKVDIDCRHLTRIFKYIISIESLNRPHESNINEICENSRPLGLAMGLTGKVPPSLFGLCASKSETERFYKRLVDFERKPGGYKNLVENLWIKTKKLPIRTDSIYDLYKAIILELDCRIPPAIVKTVAKRSNWQLVNTSWCSFNELEVPNKTIKTLCALVDTGELKSNLDIPMRDSWAFLDKGKECYYSQNISDFYYSYVAKSGNARYACSDSVSNSIQYMIDHGEVIEDLIFDLPKKEILPWRMDEDYTYHIVKSVEDMEDELIEPEDLDLTFIGAQVIKSQVVEEKPTPEEDHEESLEPAFEKEGLCFDDNLGASIGETFEAHEFLTSRMKGAKPNNPEEDIEPEPPPRETIRFTEEYWMELYNDPDQISRFTNVPCDTHSQNPFELTYMFRQDCLFCRIVSSNPHQDRQSFDDPFESMRSYPTREQLLVKLGFEEPPDPFDDSGSEGGMFGCME
jgi:hypothetical protein